MMPGIITVPLDGHMHLEKTGRGKIISSREKCLQPVAELPCTVEAYLRRSDGLIEAHFAYLEDIDVGYRAQIYGYENWYCPRAVVWHVGSGTSGSRYNEFKVRHSSRNNVYMIYKNMPFLQIILNLPLLIPGFVVKWLFFVRKGFGKEYANGIFNGIAMSDKEKKVPFQKRHLWNYVRIQVQLWVNVVRRFVM